MKKAIRLQLAVIVVGLLLAGCAARVTPELVMVRALDVLELMTQAQQSIMEAEENGTITEAQAVVVLTRMAQAVQHAQALPALLEGWHDVKEAAERRSRLDQAQVLVFSLSQALAGLDLPASVAQPVIDTLLVVNDLLLRISELRGDQ